MEKENAPTPPVEKVENPVKEEVKSKTEKSTEIKVEKPNRKGLIMTFIIIAILILLVLVGIIVALVMTNDNLFGTVTPTPTVAVTTFPGLTETPSATVAVTGTVAPTTTTAVVPTATPVTPVASAVAAIINPSSTSCPTTFQFSAQITMNTAGTVTYIWERSEGGLSAIHTLNFAAAGTQTVTTEATLNFSTTGWQRIKISAPNAITSNNAAYSLTCNHSGSWYFNFGTMTMTQTGLNATASFTNNKDGGNGTLTGTFNGPVFTGSYGSPSVVTLTFSDTTSTFTGSWNGGGGATGNWCGAKAGSNFPVGCSYAGTWNEWVEGTFANHDACQPGSNTLVLVRNNNTVHGTFCNGTLTGTISYSSPYVIYSGTYTVPGNTSDFHFYMADYNGQTFAGNYSSSMGGWCGRRTAIPIAPSGCLFPVP